MKQQTIQDIIIEDRGKFYGCNRDTFFTAGTSFNHREFLDGCTEEDIEEALIDLDDPKEEIRLVFYKNKPIGYGGYRRWGKQMGDVGILIQEPHRKKGLGIAAVAAATKACLKNNSLPFYRTSSDNTSSETIARNLGYQLHWITKEYYI